MAAAKRTNVGHDGHAFAYGPNVLVERGLAQHRDETPRWRVYRKIDTTDDKDTLADQMWDEVASYAEEAPGEMPNKAEVRAAALAADQE